MHVKCKAKIVCAKIVPENIAHNLTELANLATNHRSVALRMTDEAVVIRINERRIFFEWIERNDIVRAGFVKSASPADEVNARVQ